MRHFLKWGVREYWGDTDCGVIARFVLKRRAEDLVLALRDEKGGSYRYKIVRFRKVSK